MAVISGSRATKEYVGARSAVLEDDSVLGYAKLLLATGACALRCRSCAMNCLRCLPRGRSVMETRFRVGDSR